MRPTDNNTEELHIYSGNHGIDNDLIKQYIELFGTRSDIHINTQQDITDLSQPTPFKVVQTYTTYGTHISKDLVEII